MLTIYSTGYIFRYARYITHIILKIHKIICWKTRTSEYKYRQDFKHERRILWKKCVLQKWTSSKDTCGWYDVIIFALQDVKRWKTRGEHSPEIGLLKFKGEFQGWFSTAIYSDHTLKKPPSEIILCKNNTPPLFIKKRF